MQQQVARFELLEDTSLLYEREREREIRIIEEDILDIFDITQQINAMVNEHGEGIDQVATHIEQSRESVKSGTKEIKIATDYKQKNRTFWVKVGGIVVAIITIVLVVALV
jgi:t-SNARE complex subunit (syntaxin)